MKNIFLIVSVCFLFSCSDRDKSSFRSESLANVEILAGSSLGFVSFYLSSKNNTFLYYQLGVFDIWLIDEEGGFFKVKDAESFDHMSVDLTYLENKSQYLMRSLVPAGKYQGIMLTLNYTSPVTQIVAVNEGKEEVPYLFNSFATEMKGEEGLKQLSVMFDEKEDFRVKGTENVDVSITFDLDASMHELMIDENVNPRQFLVLPIVDIEPGITHPDSVFVEGFLTSIDNITGIELFPFVSEKVLQLEVGLFLEKGAEYSINHKQSNLTEIRVRLNALQDTPERLFAHIEGRHEEGEFKVEKVMLFEKDNNNDMLFDGFIYQNRFIGKVMPLHHSESYQLSSFYSGAIDLPPLMDAKQGGLGRVSATGQFGVRSRINNLIQLPVSIAGRVESIDKKSMILELFDISGHDGQFIFTNEPIAVMFDKALTDLVKVGAMIEVQGVFSKSGALTADKLIDLSDLEQRYKLSLPLINATPVLTVNDEGLTIEEGVGLSSLTAKSRFVGLSLADYPVEILDINSCIFTLLIERELPHALTYHYLDKEGFLSELTIKEKEGYLVSALVADGEWKKDKFVASALTTTIYSPSQFDLLDEDVYIWDDTNEPSNLPQEALNLKGPEINDNKIGFNFDEIHNLIGDRSSAGKNKIAQYASDKFIFLQSSKSQVVTFLNKKDINAMIKTVEGKSVPSKLLSNNPRVDGSRFDENVSAKGNSKKENGTGLFKRNVRESDLKVEKNIQMKKVKRAIDEIDRKASQLGEMIDEKINNKFELSKSGRMALGKNLKSLENKLIKIVNKSGSPKFTDKYIQSKEFRQQAVSKKQGAIESALKNFDSIRNNLKSTTPKSQVLPSEQIIKSSGFQPEFQTTVRSRRAKGR